MLAIRDTVHKSHRLNQRQIVRMSEHRMGHGGIGTKIVMADGEEIVTPETLDSIDARMPEPPTTIGIR